jgi:hypothetical protein
MRNLPAIGAFAILTVLCAPPAHAAEDNLGKIFIKPRLSEVNGQQFPDPELEDTVKDLKKRNRGKFLLADLESEADFLLVVVERKAVAVSGQPASKTVLATLSVKDGGAWKPATKLLSGVKNTSWIVAADQIIKQAAKWAKENSGR